MANINIHTSLDNLPRVLQNFADQIPFATAQALNATAFGLMREEKSAIAEHLDVKNTWTQRGMRVDKASKRNLTARVGNVRWYMESLTDGGKRRPRTGVNYQGRRYLLVPPREMKTGAGKLRKFASKNPFVTRLDGKLALVYRKGKRRLPLQLVGWLVVEADYAADTYPHRDIAAGYIERHWDRNWRSAMVRAARGAR